MMLVFPSYYREILTYLPKVHVLTEIFRAVLCFNEYVFTITLSMIILIVQYGVVI